MSPAPGVAVRQGSVQVDGRAAPAQSRKLKAGDWVRMTARGEMTHGTQPPAQVAAWLQGRLIVKDRPAGEVVDALRPYYSGIVILRGDTLAEPAADRHLRPVRSGRGVEGGRQRARRHHRSAVALGARHLRRLILLRRIPQKFLNAAADRIVIQVSSATATQLRLCADRTGFGH